MSTHPFTDLFLPAATARFVLFANHVLATAPAAMQRLAAHAGRVVQVDVAGWSVPWVPAPPACLLRITPAGLFEQVESGEAPVTPDLRLAVDTSQPLESARRVALGEVPNVHIEGDAGLAADMSWLMAHVRWDVAADVERVFGPGVAEGFSRAAGTAASAVRTVVQTFSGGAGKP